MFKELLLLLLLLPAEPLCVVVFVLVESFDEDVDDVTEEAGEASGEANRCPKFVFIGTICDVGTFCVCFW